MKKNKLIAGGMKERTIICNSLSKTYSITGWRLGYVIAPGRNCGQSEKGS